jgi:DNA polymerase-3 subunit gamma/tau
MLSTGAFNALLKIMEEPPPHVLFILATTEIHKVPATILSRCQRFDFKRINSGIIAARLLYIAEKENVKLDGDAAALIARLSDGGMRDALSLLDLCLTNTEEVSAVTVRECAGLVSREYLFKIAAEVKRRDVGAALKVLEDLWEKSVDYQRLCEQLTGFYRDLMIAKAVPKPDELISCLPDELDEFKAMANETTLEAILGALNILQECLARMGRTSQRRTELEMGLLKLCAAGEQRPAGDLKALENRLDRLEKAKPAQVSTEAPQKDHKMPDPAPTAEEIQKTPVEVFAEWTDILDILKDKNAALYGTLVNSKAYTGGDLLLVDAGNSVFSAMVRQDSYAKESLREAVEKVTGKKYRLGPYRPEQFEVKKAESEPLDKFLKQAGDGGVEVIIN